MSVKLLGVYKPSFERATHICEVDFLFTLESPVRMYRRYPKKGKDGQPLKDANGKADYGSSEVGELLSGQLRVIRAQVREKDGQAFCIHDTFGLPRDVSAEAANFALERFREMQPKPVAQAINGSKVPVRSGFALLPLLAAIVALAVFAGAVIAAPPHGFPEQWSFHYVANIPHANVSNPGVDVTVAWDDGAQAWTASGTEYPWENTETMHVDPWSVNMSLTGDIADNIASGYGYGQIFNESYTYFDDSGFGWEIGTTTTPIFQNTDNFQNPQVPEVAALFPLACCGLLSRRHHPQ